YSTHCMHRMEVVNKKLMHLANQPKVLNHQFKNLTKLMDMSYDFKPNNASPKEGSQSRVNRAPSTPKVKIELTIAKEKRISPTTIPRPNLRNWKGEQVWMNIEDFERLTTSTKLEATSATKEVESLEK
ncbi:unnamed protein product, partial [Ilex paraguariensis]